MPARLARVIAVTVALAIVVGTGVAWGKIRSFESGINQISPITLGAGARLFEDVGKLALEPISARGTDLVTHVKYRVLRESQAPTG